MLIPSAGSGPGLYHEWASALPAWVEPWLVTAPGRDGRFSEAVPSRLPEHSEAIADALETLSEMPFALFGHSMGGLVAFEVARILRDNAQSLPRQLFLSSVRAPFLPPDTEPEHLLSTPELLAAIRRRYGGLPSEVEASPELLAWALELLRSDLRALETHVCQPAAPLSIPITLFGGDADPSVSVEDLRPWSRETSATFTLHLFPGSHRYLETQRGALISLVLTQQQTGQADCS